MKNVKGSFILLIAAFIWGSAFVAQTTGAEYIETFAFNASRSFVGALFLEIVIGLLAMKGKLEKRNDKVQGMEEKAWPIRGGIICGVVLFLAMSCQQYGITIYPEGAGASGRAGFVTATYVILVALIEQFRGKKLHLLVFFAVVGTIAGMYMLCVSGSISSIYLGDIFVFLCALCYTGHILVVDRFKKADSLKLSCVQFLTVGVLSLVVTLVKEQTTFSDLRMGAFSILYTGILSSGIAYTLQMIGQKYAQPAIASIVMSLESVFAVLTGWIILHEMLSGRELMGCGLVFASVILAQLPQFFQKS